MSGAISRWTNPKIGMESDAVSFISRPTDAMVAPIATNNLEMKKLNAGKGIKTYLEIFS